MATGLPETLVGDSTIYLFGRVMEDLKLQPGADAYRIEDGGQPALRRRSPNHLVVNQLTSPNATIARIYAFSFQNEFFELVRPALFVVNGDGEIPLWSDADDPKEPRTDDRVRRQYAYPIGLTGLTQMGGNLATELKVWAYDRDDFSVRLDIMTGSYDRILLEYELAEEGIQGFVRGGGQLGQPAPMGGRRGRGRGRRWRSDDD
jgi:hypothetical protein